MKIRRLDEVCRQRLAWRFLGMVLMSAAFASAWGASDRPDRVPWPARGAAQPQNLARPVAPVRLQSGTFLGAGEPVANLALDQSVHLRPGRVHVIVQFDRIPDGAWREHRRPGDERPTTKEKTP